jgi:hypothetical protein
VMSSRAHLWAHLWALSDYWCCATTASRSFCYLRFAGRSSVCSQQQSNIEQQVRYFDG